MKKTGRIMTLRGDANDQVHGAALYTGSKWGVKILDDDRQGYGWKIKRFDYLLNPDQAAPRSVVSLWTFDPATLPISIGNVYANGSAASNNQCIGCRIPFEQGTLANVIDPDHVIVDTLTLVGSSNDFVPYLITLEEYELSDTEEVVQRIKEVAQNVDES